MPEMEFLNHSSDDQIKALEISSVMFFPCEEEAAVRNEWVLKNLLALAGTFWVERQGGDEELSSDIGRWLGQAVFCRGGWGKFCEALIGHSQPLRMEEQARRRQSMGIMAGHILIYLVEKKNLSVKGACRKIADEWKGRKPPAGINVSRNANRLRSSVWPAMRPASHLWAAYLYPSLAGLPRWIFPTRLPVLPLYDFPGGLDMFLAKAEYFRAQGESRRPATSSLYPFLRPGETWSVPQGYQLPDISKFYQEVPR